MDPSQLTPDQRRGLLEQAFRESWPVPPEGWVLLGGDEAEHTWQATVDSFVNGVWVATILCAQATCERALAGMVGLTELPGLAGNPPQGWEGWGFGSLLKYVREQGWVPDDLLDDLGHLCEARKPWGHWRRPLHKDSLHRRAAEVILSQDVEEEYDDVHTRLLAQEAHRSAVTAMRLYFGNYGRAPYEAWADW